MEYVRARHHNGKVRVLVGCLGEGNARGVAVSQPLPSHNAHFNKTEWIAKMLDALGINGSATISRALKLDPNEVVVEPVKTKSGDEEYLCIGVGSRQRSGKHILFLDLDGHTQERAERVAKRLIANVGCSDCYIVRSSPGNHHLVCMDMFSFSEVQAIAQEYAHKQWAKFRGNAKDFVLRIGPKMQLMQRVKPQRKSFLREVEKTQPQLVSVIKSPFSYRSKSNSLRRIFSSVWGYSIKKDSTFTDSTQFRLHVYRLRLSKEKKNVELVGEGNDLKPSAKNKGMRHD